MTRRRGWLWFAIAAAIAASGALRAADEPTCRVIVNAANPVSEMRKPQVAALFLDRRTRWAEGAASPVDQSARSALREAFSRDVLGRPVAAVLIHWQQRIGSAVDRQMPPPVKASDEDVIAHVAKEKGGIGYVSWAAALPPTVKALRLRD